MPARTKEERKQKQILAKQRAEQRRKAREEEKKQKQQQEQKQQSKSNHDDASSAAADGETSFSSTSTAAPLFPSSLSEDSLHLIFQYLPSRELGCVVMTCRTMRLALVEGRVSHLLSRLNRHRPAALSMCPGGEGQARKLLARSYGGGDTGRLLATTTSTTADEYVGYARFLEESLSGYVVQSLGGKKDSQFLPRVVDGRYASASPEHSLCRVGGGGTSGPGGSGVASWGVGRRGQLGHGKREDESTPRRLGGGIGYGIRIVQVSAGGGLVRVAHSLLLTSTGRVLSFGTAQYGQLGHGYGKGKQLSDELRPRYVDALSHVRCTCVSAGELHSAAVTVDGDLYTWGDGFCGQLGLGDKRPQLLPHQVTEGGLEDEVVESVSCGSRHTLCVTEDGEAFSFGLGHYGVLGRSYTPFEYDADAAIAELGGEEDGGGAAVPLMPPVAMNTISGPTARDGRRSADATTTTQGTTEEDGLRAHLDLLANLTLDDSSDQCVPKMVESLEGLHIVGASAGHRHSMLLDDHGSLYTFGAGTCGALGHGDYTKHDIPMRVMEFAHSDIRIVQMSAGVDISMAVSSTGDVYAWGKQEGGRVGLGVSSADVTLPRAVVFPGDDDNNSDFKAIDVECGYVHSLIVGLDGTIHLCGGVGIDGDVDGQKQVEVDDDKTAGRPRQVSDFNIWHRIAEPKAEVTSKERWKKYGKYELKGRKGWST